MCDQERRSELRRLLQKIEPELLAFPGVVGVDVGYKMVGGEETEVLSIRVYVSEKRGEVPTNERLPKTFHGVWLDVIEHK